MIDSDIAVYGIKVSIMRRVKIFVGASPIGEQKTLAYPMKRCDDESVE